MVLSKCLAYSVLEVVFELPSMHFKQQNTYFSAYLLCSATHALQIKKGGSVLILLEYTPLCLHSFNQGLCHSGDGTNCATRIFFLGTEL